MTAPSHAAARRDDEAGRAVDRRCPRCGAAFQCGISDPAPCRCTSVTLEAATLQALRSRYDGCLCVTCLQALARGAAA